ncbi:MAG: hypothetical protein EBV15_03720 [Bacteroidetes bacterium]|nr:hypothetical protein [Bacteroidota bacterium]
MENQTLDQQPQAKNMNASINVLTILTFIGCVFAFISAIFSLYSSGKSMERIPLMQEQAYQLSETSETAAEIMMQSIDAIRKQYENRYLLLIVNLLATGLCVFGALEMRKMRKNGFYLWLTGELLPILITVAIIGFNLMGGIVLGASLLFAGVFIVLYGLQVKHMH